MLTLMTRREIEDFCFGKFRIVSYQVNPTLFKDYRRLIPFVDLRDYWFVWKQGSTGVYLNQLRAEVPDLEPTIRDLNRIEGRFAFELELDAVRYLVKIIHLRPSLVISHPSLTEEVIQYGP